jgi:hypothetical protein
VELYVGGGTLSPPPIPTAYRQPADKIGDNVMDTDRAKEIVKSLAEVSRRSSLVTKTDGIDPDTGITFPSDITRKLADY